MAKPYIVIQASVIALCMSACGPGSNDGSRSTAIDQPQLKNEAAKNHAFLADMYADGYFPEYLVDKGKAILVRLCFAIEQRPPRDLDELYRLTHRATNEFNELQSQFIQQRSEIETAARESIAMDFEFIAKAYGFNADTEELIATREW